LRITIRERNMKRFLSTRLGKLILTLFILTNIVYVIMLSVTIPQVSAYVGGMKLPDMMPGGYPADYIRELFTALGEEGRKAYLTRQLPLDFLYPLLFGLTYSLILFELFLTLFPHKKLLLLLSIFPALAGTFDYQENFLLVKLLKTYPRLEEDVISMCNFSTVMKSVNTTISFTLIFILGIWVILKQYHRKKQLS